MDRPSCATSTRNSLLEKVTQHHHQQLTCIFREQLTVLRLNLSDFSLWESVPVFLLHLRCRCLMLLCAWETLVKYLKVVLNRSHQSCRGFYKVPGQYIVRVVVVGLGTHLMTKITVRLSLLHFSQEVSRLERVLYPHIRRIMQR